MNCAGIDVSTKAVDIVLLDLDTDQAVWYHYDLQAGELVDRLMSVRRTLPHPASVFWADTVAIGIERPAGRYGVAHVSAAWGAVLCTMPNKTLVKAWMPAEWRKACGLSGNAPKGRVYDWANGTREVAEDFECWSQDACDAYCIAYATRAVLEHQKQAA